MTNINYKIALLLGLDFIFLSFYSLGLDISPWEFELVFEQNMVLSKIVRAILDLKQNNFSLRIFFIFTHIINLILFFRLSCKILASKKDALLALLFFMLLPGTNSAALLVSSIGLEILGVLVFLNLFFIHKNFSLFLLIALSLVDDVFLLLALGLVAFGFYSKDKNIVIFSVGAVVLSYWRFGFDFGGLPRGYFLEIFGTYAAIFSPFVFFYFIFSLYWFVSKNAKNLDILWFIGFCAFFVSLVLSLRQNVKIQDFAPLVIIATPIMAKAFLHSWRVRLKPHRKNIQIAFWVVLVSLFFNTFITFFNKPIFLFLQDPSKHFAYSFSFVSSLASRLKDENITAVLTEKSLQKQLSFYGIKKGKRLLATKAFKNSKPLSLPIIADKKINFYIQKDSQKED